MTRLHLVRHGEPAQRWGEAADPGLSPAGRSQAAAAAAFLTEAGAGSILTSPLARCRETAQPLAAARGAPARIEPRVAEVPAPDGVDRRAWLRALFPAAFAPHAPATRWADCGPALAAWRAGLLSALREIKEDACVFTHFVVINAAVGAALGRDEAILFRPGFASVTELALIGGRLELVSLGAEVSP